MINTEKLKELIRKSGLKEYYIAEQLGLSYKAYANKRDGITQFTAPEIRIMAELLNLSGEQIIEVFCLKSLTA